jgi:hypothetical protein
MTTAQGYPLARQFFGLQAREPFLKFKPLAASASNSHCHGSVRSAVSRRNVWAICDTNDAL